MLFLSIFLSYLLGSVPFGYLLAKVLKGIDIREHGSKNIGATNVARVIGKKAGITVLVLDILKGFAAVSLFPLLVKTGRPDIVKILCAFAVVAGHNWTVFLKFKGGKGVAATAGALTALVPVVFLSSFCVWVIVFTITKYVSLSSIISAVSMVIFLFIYKEPVSYQILGIIIAVIGIYRHKENIKRLVEGRENKLKL